MRFPFPGIGVAFNIDGLGGSFYGYRAWQLFMKHINSTRLLSGILVEGDVIRGQDIDFCIGVYSILLDLDYIRDTFEAVDDPGLAPIHRRFIEKLALDAQPLPIKGNIDAAGRLITNQWTQSDHKLCKEAGWGYTPKEIPSNLESILLTELEELKKPRFS